MVKMNDVVARLKEMKGAIHVFPLNESCRSQITEIEKNIKASLGIPCINAGVEECLERKYVVCIIKKASFRPPPEPTVMLISDDGIVLGEEVLPNRMKEFLANNKDEEIIWLSEEFVMYPGRKGKEREFFVMPPVSFPEVTEMGMKNVVSCSPSAPADMMLREMHGYEDDPKLASILVGFDTDEDIC